MACMQTICDAECNTPESTREMHPSSRNQLMRDPIKTKNVRSDEFGHPDCCQSNIGSNFYPLGEIVNDN